MEATNWIACKGKPKEPWKGFKTVIDGLIDNQIDDNGT